MKPAKSNSSVLRKNKVRAMTTSMKPRKSTVLTAYPSFFGSVRDPLVYKTPKGNLEEIKSTLEESKKSIPALKKKIVKQNTIKPEVTISEFDIHKKWYDYEKNIGKEFVLPSTLMNRSAYASENVSPNQSPILKNMKVTSHLRLLRKPTGGLNPLVNHDKSHKNSISFDSRPTKSEKVSMSPYKRTRTKLLSIKKIEIANKSISESKC